MQLTASIKALLDADIPTSFERFGQRLDAQWVEDALVETGKASVRRRKLPAHLVVWLVVGMGLFRDRSIQEVVAHLGLVFTGSKGGRSKGAKTIAPSAIAQSRHRLGSDPLEEIFNRTAQTWAHEEADKRRWRDLAVYGVDGTTLRVPDTVENREEFGLPGTGRSQAGYPQVRLVALMALRSHMMAAAAVGACRGKKTGELTLAQNLWPELPSHSLVIVDSGLIDYGMFFRLSHDESGQMTATKHWLVPAKKNLRFKTLKRFGNGDELVELSLRQARTRDKSLPKTMVARAISYQIKGYQPRTLLTSLVDPQAYPATEIASLYHERWEIELGYDELKTHMLERQEALRSKTPEGIRQEVWGIALAYNLVRREMLTVAEDAGVNPLRISFRHTLQLIRVFCLVETWASAPGNIPRRLASLHEMLSVLVLPERRSERRYKRQVKIKMSSYKRNASHPGANEPESRPKELN